MANTDSDLQQSMKLTTKERWRYTKLSTTRSNIDNIKRRDEWLAIVKQFLPQKELEYLELGCAPGQYTAALAEGTLWKISGIDYSDDAELFRDSLAIVGKEATLYHMDMFEKRLDVQFDVVTSIGLVEHFRATMLDEVFELHDTYLRPGGYVVIMVPNFTGFNYLWHYIFDMPDLDRHNIDVMQPVVFNWFRDRGYRVVFNDYVGVMRLWGNSGWTRYWLVGKVVAGMAVGLSKLALLLDKVGIRFSGRTWSPTLLFIGQKNQNPNA